MDKTSLRSPFPLLLTAGIAVACARHERPDSRPPVDALATPTATPTQANSDTVPSEHATSISASAPSAASASSSASISVTPWPKDWAAYLGKSVTLEGKALDSKSGAMLIGDGSSIYIDGVDSWPARVYQRADHGQHLRVTGIVIERSDLPAFEEKPGEPHKAGIPVPPGGDLAKAKHRYLLKDARWDAAP